MPRDGSGVASKPPGSTATANTTIASAKFNAVIDDIYADMNLARPITAGGTGETTARLKDGTWRFQNTTDTTKLLALDLSGLTTATTRTLTVPDQSGTIATTAAATTDNAVSRYDGTTGQLQDSALTISDGGNDMTLTYTDNGATGGPVLQLDRNSASPAASDLIGTVSFRGKDSGGAVQAYATIVTTILDPTAATEDGQMLLQVAIAGTMTTALTLQGTTPFFAANAGVATYSATGATSGILLVGAGGAASVRTSTTTTGGATHNYFSNPNGVVGSISTSGSATTYATSSDYRRKPVREVLKGFWERIRQSIPRRYQWETGEWANGFIAHEFAVPYPSSVVGEKDAVNADGSPNYQVMQASSSEVMADVLAALKDIDVRLTAAGL